MGGPGSGRKAGGGSTKAQRKARKTNELNIKRMVNSIGGATKQAYKHNRKRGKSPLDD
jgi:hypothetical protein